MSVHVLKCLPEYFDQVLSGEKRFEIRVDDRGYKDITAYENPTKSKEIG